MKDSFIKFKNKILIEFLIKTISIALSAGLIVFSAPYLYIKVKGIDFSILYLVLIAVAIMLIIFCLLFLIFKPNDKKVAKRLDKEFNLNEKVQTMIRYEKEESTMINLQRESTSNILANISLKDLSMKFSVFFFIFVIIAMSLCVTAFAVPAYEEPSGPIEPVGPIDPDYDLDNWTVAAIKEIIDTVKASSIDESLKTKDVDLLNKLIKDLENVSKDSEMKELVITLIARTKVELDIVNTNNEIYQILSTSNTHDIVTLAIQINHLKPEEVRKALANFTLLINGSANAITELDAGFGQLLRLSNLDKNDSLYIKLNEFSNNLNNCVDSSDVKYDVQNAVNLAVQSIIPIIIDQAENKEITDYIEKRLNEIFGLTTIDQEDDESGSNSEGPTDDEDGKKPTTDNGGGLGTGEILFGSNDAFFDPEEGVVKYGDVITKYYGNIIGMFENNMIPEEYREYFEKYFEKLFGGLDDEK